MRQMSLINETGQRYRNEGRWEWDHQRALWTSRWEGGKGSAQNSRCISNSRKHKNLNDEGGGCPTPKPSPNLSLRQLSSPNTQNPHTWSFRQQFSDVRCLVGPTQWIRRTFFVHIMIILIQNPNPTKFYLSAKHSHQNLLKIEGFTLSPDLELQTGPKDDLVVALSRRSVPSGHLGARRGVGRNGSENGGSNPEKIFRLIHRKPLKNLLCFWSA